MSSLSYKPKIGDKIRYHDPRTFIAHVGIVIDCSVNSKAVAVAAEDDLRNEYEWNIEHCVCLERLTLEEMVTHDHPLVRIAGQQLIRKDQQCSGRHNHRTLGKKSASTSK